MTGNETPGHSDPKGRRRSSRGRPLDVAIIGLACRFPGAPNADAFWRNILASRDCTGDVPLDRWEPAVFFDPDATDNDRVYCRRGGYLEAPVEFDPTRYGIMPLAVEGGEPEQFLVLDAARAALEDAGLPGGAPNTARVEVVVGRGNYFNRGNLTRLQHGRIVAQTLAVLRALHPEWSDDDFEAVRADLKASLPPFEAGTIAGQLTNATAGRVADRLNLSGASYVVDAASASALVALDLGARALVERRADLAVVGAVYLAADVDFPLVFSRLGALSRGGVARPFAKSADGMLPGEGVGVVVLKRLANAERDGDRVYAVVKGVGLASDGRGAGLAAPSARGHARALRRAYRSSGIDPGTVGLVEGHGLGVPASDSAELRALLAVFPRPDRGKRALGAVSSMIGHAMPAAGMAGLIKAALALHHRVLPPTLHADDPHKLLTDEDAPFELNRTARPWVHGTEAHPRRAGVNAFGFAGVNAHAVLEEHAPTADGVSPGRMNEWETEAILLGADDRAGVVGLARALLAWLELGANDRVPLKDLAFTLNAGQSPFPVRAGLVVGSTAELRERLTFLIGRLGDPACRSIRDARGTYFWDEPLAGAGRLAFAYPGEGSQYTGMLADLCPHFPEVRKVLDTADRIARDQGHNRLPSDVLFGRGGDEAGGLWAIGTAVNVVLSAHWALHQLVTLLGLKPDAVVGHSSGEVLALAAAGAVRAGRRLEARLGELGSIFEDLERAGRVPAAALWAVAADRRTVEEACREEGLGDEVVLAIDNCPHQVVVACRPGSAAASRLRARGLICEELPFARAYHTPRFAAAIGPVRDFFEGLDISTPEVPIYSCATAARMPRDAEGVRSLAVEQWVRPVGFRSTVEAMYDDGVRIFLEVGARGHLTGAIEDTLRGRPHFAVPAGLPRRSGVIQLNHLVASLYAQGVALRPEALYSRRSPRRIDLSADLEQPRPAKPLAVGFPEMRLSLALVERLRTKDRQPARPSGSNGAPHHRPDLEPIGHANGRGPLGETTRRPGDAGSAAAFHRSQLSRVGLDADRHATGKAFDSVPAGHALQSYFETMEAFLETQRQVIDAYLDAHGGSMGMMTEPPPEPAIDATPVRSFEPVPLPNGHAVENHVGTPGGWGRVFETPGAGANPPGSRRLDPSHPDVVETPAASSSTVSVRDVLLDQVSRRTGYPKEMLDLGYDMEGDLGIDSIKRVEILGELQNLGLVSEGTDLERLSRCRTLGQVLELLEARSDEAVADEPAPLGPWAGVVESAVPGLELVGRLTLDAHDDPVVQHHTLGGRRLSALDTERLGLPVLPFTVMAEMLAQAAAALVPGKAVTALRDVQANRWIPFGEGRPLTLEIRATRDPARPDEVRVEVRVQGSRASRRNGQDGVAVSGVVVLGDARPPAPVAPAFVLEGASPCRFTADELYRDQWLFHGPALRALERVGEASRAGIEGTLRVLPRRALLPERLWPTLHTDPIVLDAFTHLLGTWGIDKRAGEEGDVMFPLRVDAIQLFSGDPPEGTPIECRVVVREVTRHRVRADADLVTPDGRVWVRILGWEDWRFYWPARYRDVFRAPDTALVGEPLPLVEGPPGVQAVWVEPPADMGKPVWRDVLEWVQLAPDERRANRARGEAEPGLTLLILDRIAAKEAARRVVLGQGGQPVYPADLVVEHDPNGRPFVRSLLDPGCDDLPAVSVAHTEGVAVALASPDPSACVGIDVERVRRFGAEFEASALLEPERRWLDRIAATPAARDEWVARLCCAKGAAAKASGLGMVDGASGVRLVDADVETGRVVVSLGAALAGRCPGLGDEPFVGWTARREDYVWAWTTGERAER
jgi:acyl transferase domain-containing protein